MIGQLVSKIAGPRVLVGVIVAAGLALGTMGYLLLDARQANGAFKAVNGQLVESLEEQARETKQLKAAMDLRDKVLSEALVERDEAIAKMNDTRSTLRVELSDDQCANTDHPDAVAVGLRLNDASGSAGEDRDDLRVPTN